jgi:drug/metabolite transporter (DMT)-like permease
MSKQIRADLSLIVIMVIWGSSFPLMKNVFAYIPIFAYLAIRFLLATGVLIIIYIKKIRFFNKRIVISGSIIGLMLFAGTAIQAVGLNYTSASKSALITGLNAIIIPIFSALLLRKLPRLMSILGVILASIGMFFLSGGFNSNLNLGDLLTFLGAIFFALQIIFIDKFNSDGDPALLAIVQLAISAFFLTILWFAFDLKPMVLNTEVVVTIIYTALFNTALAFTVITIVQKDTSPTHTAVILTAEPAFGALFASIIPNASGRPESLTLMMIIGCTLIISGMLISEIFGKDNI